MSKGERSKRAKRLEYLLFKIEDTTERLTNLNRDISNLKLQQKLSKEEFEDELKKVR